MNMPVELMTAAPATVRQAWEFRERACSACGGQNFRFVGYHGGAAHRDNKGVKTRIVECRACSLIFPNPMPHPVGEDRRYRDVHDYFDKQMQVGETEQRTMGDDLACRAERLLGGRGRFLDIGCGRGNVVLAAERRGWDAEGCDISEAFVRHARQVAGIRAKVGTVEQLRYPDDSFDVVTLIEVIEHLYDPAETLREIRRILRRGGLLYVSTPNEQSIYQSVGNLYHRLRGRDWCVNLCPTWNLYHVHGFGPDSLRYLLRGNHFEPVELITYSGTIPLPRRQGIWGEIERLGIWGVGQLAKLTRRNPYMYAWAKKVD